MPAGRPTDYTPELIPIVARYAEAGLSHLQMAKLLGVNVDTVWEWKKKYPEFSDAIEQNRENADALVERSLYQRATGYTFASEKIQVLKDGTVVRVPFLEHCPPDVQAQRYWLNNRQSKRWRERVEVGNSSQGAVVGNLLDSLNRYLADRGLAPMALPDDDDAEYSAVTSDEPERLQPLTPALTSEKAHRGRGKSKEG